MDAYGKGAFALVAEADPWARELLEGVLKPRCSRVVAVESLEAALRTLALQTPDLALLAADLPGGAAGLAAALR